MLKTKGLLVALAAMLVLALGASSAWASRGVELSVATGELGSVRADSRALTFTDTGGTAEIICEVNRTLRLERTIAKSVGARVGQVTRVDIRNCRGGSVRVLNLPWTVSYVSFAGTLPNITSVRLELRGAAFLISAFFGIAECLYRGNAQGTTVGNPVSEIRADESIVTPLFDESLSSVSCPREGIFRGVLRTSPQVRMRLI
jgi:hypothetical protein